MIKKKKKNLWLKWVEFLKNLRRDLESEKNKMTHTFETQKRSISGCQFCLWKCNSMKETLMLFSMWVLMICTRGAANRTYPSTGGIIGLSRNWSRLIRKSKNWDSKLPVPAAPTAHNSNCKWIMYSRLGHTCRRKTPCGRIVRQWRLAAKKERVYTKNWKTISSQAMIDWIWD